MFFIVIIALVCGAGATATPEILQQKLEILEQSQMYVCGGAVFLLALGFVLNQALANRRAAELTTRLLHVVEHAVAVNNRHHKEWLNERFDELVVMTTEVMDHVMILKLLARSIDNAKRNSLYAIKDEKEEDSRSFPNSVVIDIE